MAKRASRRTTQPKRATSGKAWRQAKEEGELWTLPSGNVARLRPVSLMAFINSGKIPDFLTPLAGSMVWEEIEADKLASTAEMARASAELAELICRAAFIDPVIVDEPKKDNEIAMEHIDDADKAWVMSCMIQPAEVLRGFRERQEEALAALRDGDKDRAEAE